METYGEEIASDMVPSSRVHPHLPPAATSTIRIRFSLSLLAPFAALTLPLGAQGEALFVDYLSGDLVQSSLTAPETQTIIGNYAKFAEGLECGPGGVLFALRSSASSMPSTPAMRPSPPSAP